MYKYPNDDSSGYHFYAEVRNSGQIWISGQAEKHREGGFDDDKKIDFHSRNHGQSYLKMLDLTTYDSQIESETCLEEDCDADYYSDDEDNNIAKRLWTCSVTKSEYPNHHHQLF